MKRIDWNSLKTSVFYTKRKEILLVIFFLGLTYSFLFPPVFRDINSYDYVNTLQQNTSIFYGATFTAEKYQWKIGWSISGNCRVNVFFLDQCLLQGYLSDYPVVPLDSYGDMHEGALTIVYSDFLVSACKVSRNEFNVIIVLEMVEGSGTITWHFAEYSVPVRFYARVGYFVGFVSIVLWIYRSKRNPVSP